MTGLKLRTCQLSRYESGAVPIELLVTCTRSGRAWQHTDTHTDPGYMNRETSKV